MAEKSSRRDFLKCAAWAAAGLAAAACARVPAGMDIPVEPAGTPISVEAAATSTPAAPTATSTPTALAATPTPAVPTATPTSAAPMATPTPAAPATPRSSERSTSPGFFSLHPTIEAHPEAVFVKRTNVTAKTDTQAKEREGKVLAQEIFRLADAGIPLTHRVAIKANLTCTSGHGKSEGGMGILTDKCFVEGLIQGMTELGFPPGNMTMREGNWLAEGYCPGDCRSTGYVELAERTGIHLLDFPSGRQIQELSLANMQEGDEFSWVECPEGVVFKRIPYVAPYNQPDNWLLNVAKLKAHGMGMTLCVKNLQGTCVPPYTKFCEGVEATQRHPERVLKDFQPDFAERVGQLYAQRVRTGIPRWDRPGRDWNSGYGMEMWAQRTCDSHSVTDCGLCIIEGIYGRNGNAFMEGPGPKGEAQDFMSNVLIFGVDPFRVDVIGTWLAGHEPGNFGLYHIARERGLLTVLNPREIPLYLWEEGEPRESSLDDLPRTPLATPYLRRDYGGQQEALYHMVDEPFAYGG